jgi:superfamily II DNA or RNA helicase
VSLPSGDSPLSAALAGVCFGHPFRRYQQIALDAIDRSIGQGRKRAYVVAPPGSGKTVIGLEAIRRRGRRGLVLCPNTAVQAQWLAQWHEFTPETVVAGADPDGPADLLVLTYQAICNLRSGDRTGDDGEASAAAGLDEQAMALWRNALVRDGQAEAEAADTIAELRSAGSAHYQADLTYYRRQARLLLAKGGEREQILALLHPDSRALLGRLRDSGPWTLVLDECHHLLALWGYLVKALLAELGSDTLVVGLTATPPSDLDPDEQTLYADLFGDPDFEVPTPAVVREGDLAPYQELVYLTRPLPHELAYIDSQHVRFQELVTRLFDADFASTTFVEWVQRRLVKRETRTGAEVPWSRFERDRPALALAGLRFLHEYKLELPDGVQLRERHRQPLDADDWVELLDDFCLHALRTSTDPRDSTAWTEIAGALVSLGYVLTRRGIRAYVSPVDRVLSLSNSKALATAEILGEEARSLGLGLRALVLCDYERASADPVAELRGVLDPQAGSAALLLQRLADDATVRDLDPILVTGRTVSCSRASSAPLVDWLREQASDLPVAVEEARPNRDADPGQAGGLDYLVRVEGAGLGWHPRRYVPLITRYFEEGRSRCLVGTRALLGEGWDAKRINVLIDLTVATTGTSVHQIRGRSLRLDPAQPRKVADNWDVVCLASEYPKGDNDYRRFVRKHQHYFAPAEDGEIESGVSHVHPGLSPYGPPPPDQSSTINRGMLSRVSTRSSAYDAWKVGMPYANTQSQSVGVRWGRSPGLMAVALSGGAAATPGGVQGARPGRALAGVVGAAVVLGVATAGLGLGIAGAAVALAVAGGGGLLVGGSVSSRLGRLRTDDTLTALATATLSALQQVGAIRETLTPDQIHVSLRADGYYRCYLVGATMDEGTLFSESLEQLLAPLDNPRYIVPRYILEAPGGALGGLQLALASALGGRGMAVVYHTVPTFLAANRARVTAFQRAWRQHVSPGDWLYARDPEAQAIIDVQRGQNLFDATTQIRSLWH